MKHSSKRVIEGRRFSLAKTVYTKFDAQTWKEKMKIKYTHVRVIPNNGTYQIWVN